MKSAGPAGHPGSGELLKKAGIEHADSLLLVGLHDYQDTEADIQVPLLCVQPEHVVAQFVERVLAYKYTICRCVAHACNEL